MSRPSRLAGSARSQRSPVRLLSVSQKQQAARTTKGLQDWERYIIHDFGIAHGLNVDPCFSHLNGVAVAVLDNFEQVSRTDQAVITWVVLLVPRYIRNRDPAVNGQIQLRRGVNVTAFIQLIHILSPN